MRVFAKVSRAWVAAVVVVAGTAIAAVAYLVWLHPWLAMPERSAEEIERAWAQVYDWASEGATSASLEPLRDPVMSLNRDSEAVRRAEAAESLDRDALPADADDAIEALIQWSEPAAEHDDGLGCTDLGDPIYVSLHTLGHVALASAGDDPEAPQVTALAQLAEVLRRSGSFLGAVIGTGQSEQIANWALSRGVRLPPEIDATLPREEELFSIIARESYCTVEFIANEFDVDAALLSESQPHTHQGSWPPMGLYRPKREIRVMKAWHASVLERVAEHRKDTEALIQRIGEISEEERPRSHSLELTVGPTHRSSGLTPWLESARSARRAADAAARAAGVREDERDIYSQRDDDVRWRLVAARDEDAPCLGIRVLGDLPQAPDEASFTCLGEVTADRPVLFDTVAVHGRDERFVVGVFDPRVDRIQIVFAEGGTLRVRSLVQDEGTGYFAAPLPDGAAPARVETADAEGDVQSHDSGAQLH